MENTMAIDMPAEMHESVHDIIQRVISSLPVLAQEQVALDDTCPICLMSFGSILSEECPRLASEGEPLYGGVTKLVGCGHMFCWKDLVEWIRNLHGNCPTCRHTFVDIQPPSDSDNESSDGGEYIPNEEEDEDEDEDAYLDLDADGFTDEGSEDFEVGEVDVNFDKFADDDGFGDEDDAMYEWDLTDGESFSDGDMSYTVDEAQSGEADGVSVRDGGNSDEIDQVEGENI